jgi:hypothetical protein
MRAGSANIFFAIPRKSRPAKAQFPSDKGNGRQRQRLAPMLGQAFRLIADNRANRKQARRG